MLGSDPVLFKRFCLFYLSMNIILLKKGLNIGLRVLSLAAKLLLTLYMGRYLGLADMGVYGLAFSAIMIATVVLGLRIDFVVARDLVGASPFEALRKIRDEMVFFGANYLVFAVFMLALGLLKVAPPFLLAAVFLISILENISAALYTNLISMGRPVLSTFLFFIRAGLWCFAVVAAGLLWPETRNVESIFIAWAIGEAVSIGLTFWVWRHLPWDKVIRTPIAWDWIKAGVIQCFPVWLGTIGAAMAFSVDRFVVSHFIGLKEVGIITFYSSFATALLSLAQSGIFSFAYPKMIKYHKQGDTEAFWREAWSAGWQVSLFVLVSAGIVGALIPFSAPFFGKPELANEAWALWLILAAIWVRANADTFYYILYARHQDKPLWLGALLFLIPALFGNLLFVPLMGLKGVGVSSILACLTLFFWRLYYVRVPFSAPPEKKS